VIFCAETAGRRTVVLDWLGTIGCFPTAQATCQAALAAHTTHNIIDAPIERGFLLIEPPIALITESDLIEQKTSVVSRQKTKQGSFVDPADVLHSLTELQLGDYLVHRDHGVGRYGGLVALETSGTLGDYLMLEYADEDKLYLPISALHLVTRYRTQHTSEETQRRDKLGNTRWQQAKQKAQKRIYDVAAELLAAAQARAQATGFQCQLPDADTQRFRDSFPFQETPDQRTAINAVMADLSSSQSMDRLVCGDVGFGKTEVAIQAAFLTVQSGGQVAVLVPTTLLVRQHYERFCQRFAQWPVVIAPLSRLQTAVEVKQTQDRLAEGKVDIVIGTHALLSPKISFHALGLLIIDEEQRFGVRQKEKIKALKANLNMMTLSATPIPRTLNLSLAGMRSLSMITTPPQHRLPIHTFVGSGDSQLIREAVSREVQRGGQVYYLYNDVKKMPMKLAALTEMMPTVSIQMAHGQMSPDALEKTMLDFHHQRFSLLLCSTIIESGIDMPNANTLIIDRADQFGLAQLHQIRGRVGRSHHQAYAYCLIPRDVKLRKTAERRLEALKSLDSLGSGLMLATHDLEIRGAGEVLGESQSGQMNTLGVPLFMQLLEEAVDAAAGATRELKPSDIEVDLGVSALIPPEYISDIPVRLALYQKLNHITSPAALGDLKADCIDQFGPIPEPLTALFYTAQLRCLAQRVGIKGIQCLRTSATITLASQHHIAIDQVIQLIQQHPSHYQLRGENTLRIQLSAASSQDRFTLLSECIHRLTAS
jgi:transcription-repair coupling factor (superfamily II helicase)